MGRLGKLKLVAAVILFLAALAFHLSLVAYLSNNDPGDSKLYIQLAVNIVEHGVYSNKTSAPFSPTFMRMPGYPLFLAGIFEIFGSGNAEAVRIAQAFLFWLTCIMAAMIAAKWVDSSRKTKAFFTAFILAAFCPFMAIYAATVLTETSRMFLLTASILAATIAFSKRSRTRSLVWWGIAGLAAGLNVFSRPDAGLFAFGVGLALVISVFIGKLAFMSRLVDRFGKGLIFSLAFMLPLIPWTIRNEAVFGRFQPLSPFYAEDEGEFVPRGYYKWVRTWIDDSAYIDPMIWSVGRKPIRIEDVPAFAFSSDEEKQRVAELLDKYNDSDPEHPATLSKKEVNAEDDSDDQTSPNDDSSDDKAGSDDQGNDDETGDTSGDVQQDDASSDDQSWDLKITPEVDKQFEAIASERISRDPWCYYLCTPAKRLGSMWFDTHSDWYPFNGELFPLEDLDHNVWQHIWLPIFAGLNLIYTFLSLAGLYALKKERSWTWLILVLAVSLPRILFLGSLENPEPRYLVEFYIPATILGGVYLAHLLSSRADAANNGQTSGNRD